MLWAKLTTRFGLIGYLLVWLIYFAIGAFGYEVADAVTHKRHQWSHLVVFGFTWATLNSIFVWLTNKSRAV